MVCAGTAVLLHVQMCWVISAESIDLLALAQRFERRDAIMAPSRLWIGVFYNLGRLAMLSWPWIGVLECLAAPS